MSVVLVLTNSVGQNQQRFKPPWRLDLW